MFRNNYIFKCNYCDGGANAERIGFAGGCSDTTIKHNIEIERPWCSNPQCPCRRYAEGKISRQELNAHNLQDACQEGFDICHEAKLLSVWKVLAGTNNRPGPKQGTKRTLPGVAPGHLCVLTTRLPEEDTEAQRVIFAAFIIGECDEGSKALQGFAAAAPGLTITFNNNEARKLRLWDYHKNPNAKDKIQWGSGLYRKCDYKEALTLLDAMIEAKETAEGKAQVQKMKEAFLQNLVIID